MFYYGEEERKESVMEKNVNKAIETIKALRREFASDAIEDYEIPPFG